MTGRRKHNLLLRRIFLLVVAAVVLTALFTTAVYNVVSRSVFAEMKIQELVPKAKRFSHFALAYQKGRISREYMDAFLFMTKGTASSSSLLNAYVMLVDVKGEVWPSNTLLEEGDTKRMLDRFAQPIFNGDFSEQTGLIDSSVGDMVCVSVPVIDQRGAVTGVVLLFVPMMEAMAAMNSLNSALFISLMVVIPIVALLTLLVSSRIVRPLRQMRDVAIAMAGGDFTIQADDVQLGEVGQLGRSLNYLSRRLSSTISDLRVERNRLRQTVDGLSEGIIAVDTLCNVNHYNRALMRMFESQRRQSDDDRLNLIPDAEIWKDLEKAVNHGEASERNILLPDRVLRARITPLEDTEHAIVGAVGLISDITQSERLERTRRDYVANVSHEMRTPLTAMRALVEPMREGMVKSETTRQRYYDILLRETMRLSRLIDDLLELSRLQSGALALDTKPLSLKQLLMDLNEKFTYTAEESGLEFSLEVDVESCPMVVTNADRVEQVLVILLDNAIKYTGIAKQDSEDIGKVSLSARWDEHKVYLSVSDNGPGISEADVPYVFDRFYKVDKAHSGLGSGLGLSIAKELLNWMDETIEVRSKLGEGSTFTFSLTRLRSEE